MAITAFKYVPKTAVTTFAFSSVCFFFYDQYSCVLQPKHFTFLCTGGCWQDPEPASEHIQVPLGKREGAGQGRGDLSQVERELARAGEIYHR